MGLEITCPNCKASFKNIPEEHLGKSATCKKCETKFKIQQINNLEDNNQNKPLKNIEITMYKDENKIPFSFKEGDVILDLYEVKSVLGQGGMGIVYKVYHKEWKVDLAMKNPLPKQFDKPKAIENFEREAETWIQLGLHPYVVSCYYVRQLGGTPRVFAECVDGGTLRDWIRNGKLTQIDKIIDVAIQFAWGLHYAHENGVVHQDVKPANVMMTPEGIPKVTDFGLAKYREMTELTSDIKNKSIWVSYGGMTQAYCSPEQASKRPLTRKTDIWSWGISVLEMFTGGVDWIHGQLAPHALDKYIREDNRIKIPDSLADLLKHCFKENPSDRPEDMGTISETLKEIYREVTGNDYIRETPKNIREVPDTLNNMATSMLDLGKKEKALELWDKALQIDSTHIESIYNQGLLKHRMGLIKNIELINDINNILLSEKNRYRLNNLLIDIYCEVKYFKEASDLLEEVKNNLNEDEYNNFTERINKNIIKEIPRKKSDIPYASSVSLSPDNHFALIGGWDYSLTIWNIASSECFRSFKGHKDRITSVLFSYDGCFAVSASEDITIKIWEVDTCTCYRTFQGHTQTIASVTISQDRCFVVSGSYDWTLILWDVLRGKHIKTFKGHDGNVTSVALAADNSFILSGSSDNTIKVWDAKEGKCLRTFNGHSDAVNSISLSYDNRFALSGGNDNTIKLWDVSTGDCLRTFNGHKGKVNCVSMSKNNHFALSASDDNTVRMWDIATGECLSIVFNNNAVQSVSFSKDNTLLIYTSGGLFTVCSIPDNMAIYRANYILSEMQKSEKEYNRQYENVNRIEDIYKYLKNDNYYDACNVFNTYKNNIKYEHEILVLVEPCSILYRHLCRTKIRRIIPYKVFDGHSKKITEMILSNDSRFLLSGSADGSIILWDINTGECSKTFEGHNGSVTSVSISQDSRLALSGGSDHTIKLWDTATGKFVKSLHAHTQDVLSVTLSKDNSFVLSGSKDKTIKLSDTNDGICIKTFRTNESLLTSLSISQDNRFILSGNTLQLWDIETGRCLRNFHGYNNAKSILLSDDDCLALSEGYDNTLNLWNISSGKCIKIFHLDATSLLDENDSAITGSEIERYFWTIFSNQTLKTFNWNKYKSSSCFPIISKDWRFVIAKNEKDESKINVFFIDWELIYKKPIDWDEGALPYIELFINQHTPYASNIPLDREPTNSEIKLALTRRGKVSWTEEDFLKLNDEIAYAGYGWLKTKGVRLKLYNLTRNISKDFGEINNETTNNYMYKNANSNIITRILIYFLQWFRIITEKGDFTYRKIFIYIFIVTFAMLYVLLFILAAGDLIVTLKYALLSSTFITLFTFIFINYIGNTYGSLFYSRNIANYFPQDMYDSKLKTARYQMESGNYRKAIEIVNQIIEIEPMYSEALFLKVQILLYGFDDKVTASEYLNKVIEQSFIEKNNMLYQWAVNLEQKINGQGTQNDT
ncbi:MAG: protein kinase [Nitrospirae bacterium]|nr:protein kinase [Nitrospirota bacterium]